MFLKHLLFVLLIGLFVPTTLFAQNSLKVVNNHPELDFLFTIEYGNMSDCKVKGQVRNFLIRKKGTVTLQIPQDSPDLMLISVKDDHNKGLSFLYTPGEECPQLARKEPSNGVVVVWKKTNRLSINPF